MITTVIFDLDDTLYDEVEYRRSGFASVAEFLADSPDRPSAPAAHSKSCRILSTLNTFRRVYRIAGKIYLI